ncbi:hypothetical protein P775_23970 [Puniceibacterium antarcticum]|uniref:Uncharacterized protein n=1 Tax=Puniceibacterium antarcticum TaxID=1206336 RepID=A0A2G8R7X0_9RHOB|nr:hypothetical protein [Puniceibacterium antarcticum]PIL17637.1 hypothetical protein P775_23970 [Puniceibacterium antarcticum]
MPGSTGIRPSPFTLVSGGQSGPDSARPKRLQGRVIRRRPVLTSDALACEMAQIYALTLLRDIPFADLLDPQRDVRIDADTRFTLHDLQTQLCQLPWPSGQHVPQSAESSLLDLLALCIPGEADHPAPSAMPPDDRPQSPPQTAFGSILSAFFHSAPPRAAGPTGGDLCVPGIADPRADDSMSYWLRWIEACCGAKLPLPDRPDPSRQRLHTPRDLAFQVHNRHSCQVYFSTALQLLSQGAPADSGALPVQRGRVWSAQRVLTLMLNGARSADSVRLGLSRGGRFARPGVVAARWTLIAAGEDQRAGPETALERAALDRLRASAPRLLHWITQLNRVVGTGTCALPDAKGGAVDGWSPVAFRENLMLPRLDQAGAALCPALGVGKAVLAGVQVTLLKALFAATCDDTGATLSHRHTLTYQLDRLAANMVLGRSIAGGFYGVENRNGLLHGQSLALSLLRDSLEDDGLPAILGLRNFDGQQVVLQARRSAPGAVRVSLQLDGAYARWPVDGDCPSPFLQPVA